MLLNIKEMEVRKLPFAVTWQPGQFDLADSLAIQKGPLSAEGVAELLEDTGGQVRVKGRVLADLETECDRCLGRATFHIDTPFDLFYSPVAPDKKGETDEISLDEGEAEMGFYELPGLELEDIVREQVLFQLPMQRLCKEDCQGICPLCGSNRNEKSCNCEAHPGDDRWSALKEIDLKEIQVSHKVHLPEKVK